MKNLAPPLTALTSDELSGYLDTARRDLSGNILVKKENYALTLVDPYVAAAVGDLLSFAFDQKEKADFLTRLSSGYSDDQEMIQPGIANVYYQLSDAKLFSESLWPLNHMIAELERAKDGYVYIVSQTEDKVRHDPSIRVMADKIIDAYNRNLFLYFIRTLEIYNQRVLAGERLSDFHKQNWTQAFSQLNAVLYARFEFPTESFGDVPITHLDGDTAKRWPGVELDPHMFFNAYVAAGLSAILRKYDGRMPSVDNCLAANYYVKRAEDEIAKLDLNAAVRGRAQQYVLAVDNLVRGACTHIPRPN